MDFQLKFSSFLFKGKPKQIILEILTPETFTQKINNYNSFITKNNNKTNQIFVNIILSLE